MLEKYSKMCAKFRRLLQLLKIEFLKSEFTTTCIKSSYLKQNKKLSKSGYFMRLKSFLCENALSFDSWSGEAIDDSSRPVLPICVHYYDSNMWVSVLPWIEPWWCCRRDDIAVQFVFCIGDCDGSLEWTDAKWSAGPGLYTSRSFPENW